MKKIAIIGGGAAGMACAVFLAKKGHSVTVLERGERLGKKLSATGNGQGNVTNVNMGAEHYHSDDGQKIAAALEKFGCRETVAFLESLGGIFLPDARGRMYPASRQASSVTDLLRREISRRNVDVCFGAQVSGLTYGEQFTLTWAGGQMCADAVILAAGGCAAPNFGTDGNGYALAKKFSHTVTELSPALVQLRCNPADVRGLKGIRTEANAELLRGGKHIYSARGDVLFTESGLSGDAIFRISSYARKGDTVTLDLLPDVPTEKLLKAYRTGGDLVGVVNNGLARVLEKKAQGEAVIKLVKSFPLEITGTLGFAYAQVTKGGIPLRETDEHLMSKFQKDLYFIGEILNVDGECGGYNLQWAFTSAYLAAEGIGL
ncbi:MAG: aminoacetone oxidase family FAD-binding enzyme [Clostridiales bacterium]|nr:aminoacetone oxidase family FAD-binding enzyme [Clostridiales bacterium]